METNIKANHIAVAKEKAARLIAKAEKEAAILEALPDLGTVPLVVVYDGLSRSVPSVIYKPESFANMLAIFDAFEVVRALDCKGQYRRITPDGAFDEKEHGAILADYQGWIELSSRCAGYMDGAQDASFRFYARLATGATICVHMDITGAYFGKCPFPMDLRAQYRNSSLSGKARGDWSVTRPTVAQVADDYCSFGTGAPLPGMAHQGRAMFSDLRAYIASKAAE